MEETISLRQIFETLRKHITSIIICMFIGLGIAGVATFFIITPQYSSQAQMAVTLPQSNNAVNTNDVSSNLQMINTYKDIIVGDRVMDDAREYLESEYDIHMTSGQIKSSIQVVQNQNSMIFSIQSTNESPVTAERIANTVAQMFRDSAKEVYPSIEEINIVSKASAGESPVSPNNKLNLAIGLVLGMMIGVGLAFLLELLDRTVKDDKFVTETLGFTILGTVPEMTQKELAATVNQKTKPKMAMPSVIPTNKKKTEAKPDAASRRSRSRV